MRIQSSMSTLDSQIRVIDNVFFKPDSGWLLARHYEFESGRYFPAFLKVAFTKHSSTIFSPLEGKYKGELFVSKSSKVFNTPDVMKNEEILLKVIKNKNEMIFNNHSYSVVSSGLSDREMLVGLPDYPHFSKIPSKYLNEAKNGSRFATTWFPLFTTDGRFCDQYLHFGTYSEGCLTFNGSGQEWEFLYFSLLTNRLNRTEYLAKVKIL